MSTSLLPFPHLLFPFRLRSCLNAAFMFAQLIIYFKQAPLLTLTVEKIPSVMNAKEWRKCK